MAALVEGWRVEKRALLSLFVPWHTVDRQHGFWEGETVGREMEGLKKGREEERDGDESWIVVSGSLV